MKFYDYYHSSGDGICILTGEVVDTATFLYKGERSPHYPLKEKTNNPFCLGTNCSACPEYCQEIKLKILD